MWLKKDTRTFYSLGEFRRYLNVLHTLSIQQENSRAQVDELVNSLLSTKNKTASEDEATIISSESLSTEALHNIGESGLVPLVRERREMILSVTTGIYRVDIPPRVPEAYEKGTQTDVFEFDYGGADGDTSIDGISFSPTSKGSHRRMRLSAGSAEGYLLTNISYMHENILKEIFL